MDAGLIKADQLSGSHVFLPASPGTTAATAQLCHGLVAADIAPDKITVVWLQSSLSPPDLPDGVVQIAAPKDFLDERSALSEGLHRFRSAIWWARQRRAHGERLAGPAHWYICHPDSYPANDAFFRDDALSMNLLPDGLLNYLPSLSEQPSVRRSIRHVVSRFAGWMAGLDYRPRPLGKHMTRFETGRYTRTYGTTEDGYATPSGELVILPTQVEHSASTRLPRLAVLADQPLDSVADAILEDQLIQGMADHVASLGVERVIYKPHPRGPDRLSVFADLIQSAVEAAPTGVTAEDVIEQTGAGVLISFYSTVLTMTGHMPGLRRIAILPYAEISRQPGVVERLKTTFAANGVELPDVLASQNGPATIPARKAAG